MSKAYNPLLVKDRVGHGRATCYDLPPPDFVYGGQNAKSDSEGAFQLITTWAEHQPSVANKINTGPNHVNKNKTRYGAEDRTAVMRAPALGVSKAELKTRTFGKANKASEPINDIVNGRFALDQDDDAAFIATNQVDKKPPLIAKSNKAHEIFKAAIAQNKQGHAEEKANFRIQRFTKVGPKFKMPINKIEKKERIEETDHITGLTYSLKKKRADVPQPAEEDPAEVPAEPEVPDAADAAADGA